MTDKERPKRPEPKPGPLTERREDHVEKVERPKDWPPPPAKKKE